MPTRSRSAWSSRSHPLREQRRIRLRRNERRTGAREFWRARRRSEPGGGAIGLGSGAADRSKTRLRDGVGASRFRGGAGRYGGGAVGARGALPGARRGDARRGIRGGARVARRRHRAGAQPAEGGRRTIDRGRVPSARSGPAHRPTRYRGFPALSTLRGLRRRRGVGYNLGRIGKPRIPHRPAGAGAANRWSGAAAGPDLLGDPPLVDRLLGEQPLLRPWLADPAGGVVLRLAGVARHAGG